mmetsp:Transcript_3430/g.10842  ORF Transcript_3430/g.10842 Transcript_3430/m.10842 type:complete len:281 (-) Transcript_3430:506-1348(-)
MVVVMVMVVMMVVTVVRVIRLRRMRVRHQRRSVPQTRLRQTLQLQRKQHWPVRHHQQRHRVSRLVRLRRGKLHRRRHRRRRSSLASHLQVHTIRAHHAICTSRLPRFRDHLEKAVEQLRHRVGPAQRLSPLLVLEARTDAVRCSAEGVQRDNCRLLRAASNGVPDSDGSEPCQRHARLRPHAGQRRALRHAFQRLHQRLHERLQRHALHRRHGPHRLADQLLGLRKTGVQFDAALLAAQVHHRLLHILIVLTPVLAVVLLFVILVNHLIHRLLQAAKSEP